MTAPVGVPDTQSMWEATARLPEQVAQAAVDAAMWAAETPLPERERVDNIVVLGMGGSGVAGDVLAAAASPYLSVPVVVVKSYVVPAFVSDSTLVFAISFSGDTEETVEAVAEAQGAGAKVVVVTGGGELSRFAERAELAAFALPKDIPQPRAALGAMAMPPIFALQAMGFFPGASEWVDQAVIQLRRRRDAAFLAGSDAEQVAIQIGDTIPLVESSHMLGSAAAQRWKTQINENAKRPAFWSMYPELCHNEVVGWGRPELSRDLTIVNLRHDHEHPQVARRVAEVSEMVAGDVSAIVEVRAEGEGELAQLLDLMMVGDAVSLHLAARDGIDPGPVTVLEDLKRRLRRG